MLKNTDLQVGNVLENPTDEYDGAKLLFVNGKPMLDTSFIHFYKQKLIGYDRSFRITNNYGVFVIFQKPPKSGVIINMGSNTCFSIGFEGRDGEKTRQITANSIQALLKEKELFD